MESSSSEGKESWRAAALKVRSRGEEQLHRLGIMREQNLFRISVVEEQQLD